MSAILAVFQVYHGLVQGPTGVTGECDAANQYWTLVNQWSGRIVLIQRCSSFNIF